MNGLIIYFVIKGLSTVHLNAHSMSINANYFRPHLMPITRMRINNHGIVPESTNTCIASENLIWRREEGLEIFARYTPPDVKWLVRGKWVKVTLTSVLNQINLILVLNQINLIPVLYQISLIPVLNWASLAHSRAQPASQTGPVKQHKEAGVCVVNDIAQAKLPLGEWRTYIRMISKQ